jgi:glycosyltransferase involved in cell wall biosynthesis
MAALICRVPSRIYTLHGLRFEGETGLRKALLRRIEWVSCRSATQVVAVSKSVALLAVRWRLKATHKIRIFGEGSVSGVSDRDLQVTRRAADDWRSAAGIRDAPTAVFVGRLVRDKGIPELIAAWPLVLKRVPGAQLVVVGTADATAPLATDVRNRLISSPSCVLVGHLDQVGLALSSARVLVLPSLREGMPTVVLEAAALGVPSVVTDATGCVDAVVNQQTGLVVRKFDVEGLADAVGDLLSDPKRAKYLGSAARERVLEAFDPEKVVSSYFALIERDLRARSGGA